MKRFCRSIIFVLSCCGFVFAQESKPVRILEQPKPELPKNYGTLDAEGAVRFLVEFLADGQVGSIKPIGSFIKDLDQKALEAAKNIKFEPALNNGEPVNAKKVVEYLYSWRYGGWKIPQSKIAQTKTDEKAEAVLKKAIEKLGGERYLQVKSSVSRGRFSVFTDGAVASYQSFVDVIVYPNKERTDFKEGGVKIVQTNTNETGWIFDGAAGTINQQSQTQIENFKRSLRVSIDHLLRGDWRGKASLSYIGKRQATLGKRNEVVKLMFGEDFAVEFEFSDEFFPAKALYKRLNADKEEVKEEDRYAQFVEFQGIKTPLIVDHFTNGVQTSRINYESIEFNKTISDSIFTKPNSAKDLKKDLKL